MTLRDRLIRYYKTRHTMWISSGELQRIVGELTTYTPANVSRRLRELQNENLLEVKQVKGHAWYKYKDQRAQILQQNQEALAYFESL